MQKLERQQCNVHHILLTQILQETFTTTSRPLLKVCYEWERVNAERPHPLRNWWRGWGRHLRIESAAGCFGFLRQPSPVALQKPATTTQELMILSRCLCCHAVGWNISYTTRCSLYLNSGFILGITPTAFATSRLKRWWLLLVFLWVTAKLVCDWHSVWV